MSVHHHTKVPGRSILRSNSFLYNGFVLFAFLAAGLSAAGCTHVVNQDPRPLVDAGSSFSLPVDADQSGRQQKWWQVFNDPVLDALITKALTGNFTLKQVYASSASTLLLSGRKCPSYGHGVLP